MKRLLTYVPLLIVASFFLFHVGVAHADVITPTNTIILSDDGSNAIDYYGSAIVEFILIASFWLGFWMGVSGIRID